MLFKKSSYNRFVKQNLSLTDQLAAIRSFLANERTFLSYQRTALTVLVGGFSLIKFFQDYPWIQYVGYALIPFSVAFVIVGLIRYYKMIILIFNLEIADKKAKPKEEIRENV
jgi:putative membrane protein